MFDFSKPFSYVFNEKDWNPTTKEIALADSESNSWNAYIASKKESESAAWNYFNSLSSPTFTHSTILPSLIWGEANQPTLKSLDDGLNESLTEFWALLSGKRKEAMPEPRVLWTVGVEECALAQIRILQSPTAPNGQRYLVSLAKSYDWNDILAIFYKLYPERKSLFPPLRNNSEDGHQGKWNFDNSKIKKELGIEIEENMEALVKRTGDKLIELEKKNCDVIVFPEYFLTGVIAHDPHRLAHPEHPVDGKQGSMKYEKEQNEERERQERELEREESTWIKYMSDLAKEYSIDVVAGTIVEREWIHRDNSSSSSMNRKEEEKEGKKPRLFNSAYYIDKRGEIVGRYRKRNLWWVSRTVMAEMIWVDTRR